MARLTVIVDKREQKPLLFPDLLIWTPPGRRKVTYEVDTQVEKMDAGDYAIAGREHRALVERKAGLHELMDNFAPRDWARFSKAFTKFVEATDNPILFIEQMPDAWWVSGNTLEIGHALDRLFSLVALHGVDLLWGSRRATAVGPRRKLGELVLRRMLACTGDPND